MKLAKSLAVVVSLGIFSLLPLVSIVGAAEKKPCNALVSLNSTKVESVEDSIRLIREKGGEVAVVSPPSLIGYIPEESKDSLIGKAGIEGVYYGTKTSTETTQSTAEKSDKKEEDIVPIAYLIIKPKNSTKGMTATSDDDLLSLIYLSSCEITNSQGEKIEIEIEPDESKSPIPSASELLQSYPNPAGDSCYIPFKLSEDSEVRVEIYNILGQRVRTIDAGARKAGSYTKKDRAIYWGT